MAIKKVIPPTKTKTYRSINSAISSWVNKNSVLWTDKGRWYAGITNDERRRKIEHTVKNDEKMTAWRCWNARTLRISSALEDSLSDRGFCNAPFTRGAKETSVFIYVYKKYPTGFE